MPNRISAAIGGKEARRALSAVHDQDAVMTMRGLLIIPSCPQRERLGVLVNFAVTEHPRESINWRRYRSGCPHYRVRWFLDTDTSKGEPLYQVFCLMNTPAQSWEESEKCLASRHECWRIAEARERAAGVDIPLESVRRRRPANTPA